MNLEQMCHNYRAFYPHVGRLAFCGLPWSLTDALLAHMPTPTWSAWQTVCETLADARASRSVLQTVALLHFAAFKETEQIERKLTLQRRMRTLFPHVLADSPWRGTADALAANGDTFPAWWVERAQRRRKPHVMILLGGLDSAKEVELWHFANGFLHAGIDACLLLDGPGQGEARTLSPFRLDAFTPVIERAAQAARARYGTSCDITLFGVSLGGFVAFHVAQHTTCVRRAICFSCGTDWSHLDALPADVQALFAYAADIPPDQIAGWAATHLRLPPHAPRIPVRIDHGTFDRIMPVAACRRLAAQYPEHVQLHEYADGHVFLHHVHDVITDAAQWILGEEALCANF